MKIIAMLLAYKWAMMKVKAFYKENNVQSYFYTEANDIFKQEYIWMYDTLTFRGIKR